MLLHLAFSFICLWQTVCEKLVICAIICCMRRQMGNALVCSGVGVAVPWVAHNSTNMGYWFWDVEMIVGQQYHRLAISSPSNILTV
jgi:hypothetical protein